MSLGHAIKYNKETGKLEWNEGYRYEDLTEENKNIIDTCNYLLESIDSFSVDYELEEGNTLDKIKKEIALEVIEELKEYLSSLLDDIQVGLIEGQIEE